MAECEQQQQEQVEDVQDETDEPSVAYKAPAEKSVDEIMKTDQDDESLIKYKNTLLGQAPKTKLWPDKPNLILRKMSIEIEDRDDKVIEIDLEDDSQLKNMKFPVKEGSRYKIVMTFHVQSEIVSGLKLVNSVSRLGKTTKEIHMVGSYGPKEEAYVYKSSHDEFPKGMIMRGEYKVKSLFTDDDKNEHLKWEWIFVVKKDWKD